MSAPRIVIAWGLVAGVASLHAPVATSQGHPPESPGSVVRFASGPNVRWASDEEFGVAALDRNSRRLTTFRAGRIESSCVVVDPAAPIERLAKSPDSVLVVARGAHRSRAYVMDPSAAAYGSCRRRPIG